MQINEKIKLAIDLCSKENDNSFKFNYIYPFTTENINAYINKFNLEGKSALMVGSSGDQVLNAILYNCNDITVYDICPFTKEYFYLKVALIKLLSRQQYLKFLCYKNYSFGFLNNINSFDDDTFKEIYSYLEKLDLEIAYFWRELFSAIKGKQIRKELFNSNEYSKKVVSIINRYLQDDDKYNIVRNKVDQIPIEFITGNIFDISIDRKYDNIFLSNIAAYYKLDKFKILFNKLDSNLNINGKMLVSYLYDTDIDDGIDNNINSIYNLKEVHKILSEDVIIRSFVGSNGLAVNDKKILDSIIIYKKTKRK